MRLHARRRNRHAGDDVTHGERPAAAAPSPQAGATAPTGGGSATAPASGGASTSPAITVALSRSYRAFRRYTLFSTLQLKAVPSGSNVIGACKYKHKPCSGKARRAVIKRNAAGTLSLTNFTKLKLKPGSVITIKVTKPRRSAPSRSSPPAKTRAPLTTTRCTPPASSKIVSC